MRTKGLALVDLKQQRQENCASSILEKASMPTIRSRPLGSTGIHLHQGDAAFQACETTYLTWVHNTQVTSLLLPNYIYHENQTSFPVFNFQGYFLQ